MRTPTVSLKLRLLLLTPTAALFLAASAAAMRPPDWEPPCGDGVCRSTETCSTCPDDCGPCAPSCPLNDPNAEFFVRQQYRDFLGREPQPLELSQGVAPINSCYHLGDLACANTEKVKMSRAMWEHPEFRQQSQTFGLTNWNPPPQYNSWDFIYLCYTVYLRRAPNAPPDNNWNGFDFWKGGLDNCTDNAIQNNGNVDQCYKDIINAFLHSMEYRARFNGCS